MNRITFTIQILVMFFFFTTSNGHASNLYVGYYYNASDQFYIDRFAWDGADSFTKLNEKIDLIDLNSNVAYSAAMMSFGPDGNLYVGYYYNASDQFYIDRFAWDGADSFTKVNEKIDLIDLNSNVAYSAAMMSFGPDGNLYVGYYYNASDQFYIDRFAWDGADSFTKVNEKIDLIDLNSNVAYSEAMMSFGPDDNLYIGYYYNASDQFYIDRFAWDGADSFTKVNEKIDLIDLNSNVAYSAAMMSFEYIAIPEPLSIGLVLLSVGGLMFRRIKKS